jgi:hypothetical protein
MFGGVKRNHYLCIDNERSSRVRGEITFAEGRLRPTFIIYKGSPMLSEGNERDTLVPLKYNDYLYTTMKNLLILLFLPLFSVGISLMICRPLPCEPLVEPTYKNRYV